MDGDIIEYQHIKCTESQFWSEERIKECPELAEDTVKNYTINDELPEGQEPPQLFSTYVELGKDYRYMSIIQIKGEPWLGYYDKKKQRLFISGDLNEGVPPYYDGIDTQTLIKLTKYLEWDNFRVKVYYYDYEESILEIKYAQSNIRPDNLTTGELELLSEKIGEHLNGNDDTPQEIELLRQEINELKKEIKELKKND